MSNQGSFGDYSSRSRTDLLRVASNSDPNEVAGAIAGKIRETGRAKLRAIGVTAVNQTVIALTISKAYLEADGIQIGYNSVFEDIEVNGQERTAINFYVFQVENT